MQPPQLSRLRRPALAAAALLILGACARQAPPTQVARPFVAPACGTGLCVITDTIWNHIDQRHCQGCVANDKSAFINTYCGSKANAVTFCQTLMGRSDCASVQQANGRIAYTATFAADVGNERTSNCGNTSRGTVIYDPTTGGVVTQFPGNP